ncbi:MAG: LacI family DNA-binding transcriptional regulator [Anaerolineae bacterium]|jgi:LacI family transcriptional regulator|nr:LacI family DNA-binding transcriptional regulator [Anaerolineae bacterium]
MIKRPTLADIADAASVSLMTVSRAINNKPGVSEELRQEILALANELGYHPNQIARGLATNQTTSVGLIVPDNTNPFFAQIARGVEDAAYEHGYSVFLVNTVEDPTRELEALNSLWQKDVDGLIWCSARVSVEDLKVQLNRFPAVVLLNRELEEPLSHAMTLNVHDHRGARLAVAHFVGRGRRRIAYLNGPSHSLSAHRRLQGYYAALTAANLPLDSLLEECCIPDTESGYEAALALLKRCPDVDAILAFNDLVAVGAMQACQALGRRVPEDIGIIGFDDIPLATIIKPQLTTLHVNLMHIGKVAMQSLLDMMGGVVCPAAMLIEPELYVRDSA